MVVRENRVLYRTWRFFHRHSFGFLGLLALATFGIGCYGFFLAFANQGISAPLLDIAYDALQLFTVEFGPGTSLQVDNPYLDFARFFAPLLTLVSLISLVMAHYLNRYLLAFYLRYVARDHVVICGLVSLGPATAKRLAAENRPVIVIEPDRDNPEIDACRAAGAFVLCADCTSRSVLRHVAIDRASDLFIFTGDDAKNLECAEKARACCERNRKRREPLHCYCHIGDAQLCANIRGKALLTAADSQVFLEPFNIYQIAGYCLMQDGPLSAVADSSTGDGLSSPPAPPLPSPHVVIIGVGRMGEALLVRLVREWRDGARSSGRKLQITLIDRRAARLAEVVQKYIRLERYAGVTCIPLEILDAETLLQNRAFLEAMKTASDLYYCIDNPSLGLSIALSLAGTTVCTGHERGRVKACTIHIWSTRETGLTSLTGQFSEALPECRTIREFVITTCACCLDIVRWGMSEQMARLNHEQYLENERERRQKTGEPMPGPQDAWDALPEDLKVANRDQAQFIGTMLVRAGFTVAPLTDWDAPLVDFEKHLWREGGTLLERMAEWEHERWVDERRRSGWSYADIPEKDPKKKLHPQMKAYNLLEEDVKDKDRHYIRSIPESLYRMDLKLVRIRESGACEDVGGPPEVLSGDTSSRH